METVRDFIFLGSKITADGDCSHEIKRSLLLGRKAVINLDSWDISLSKKQRHYFANKGPYSQTYYFSSSHVWMWELDHKKGWVPKNWFLWTVVLEKTLESPLNSRKMTSLTQWTWVWVNSRRLGRTGKPGMLQSMGSKRVGPSCSTEQQQQQ